MEYMRMTKAELQALCNERGIGYPKKATKAEMADLLESDDLLTPIEVEAQVVENDIIPVNVLDIDADAMAVAAVELTRAVDDAATAYGELQATPEQVSQMPVKDIRVCEDGIAAAINAVEDRRKALTRMLTEPKKTIDAKCREMTDPLKELAALYADAREGKYLEGYEAQYRECAELMGMAQLPQQVPFSRLLEMNPRWKARTANPVKVQERISEEVARIARDWRTLVSMKSSMPFYDEAEGEFFTSLDLQKALERNEARKRESERVDAMRAEQAENREWYRTATEKDDWCTVRRPYVIRICLSEAEKQQLIGLIQENEIGTDRTINIDKTREVA